MQEVFEKIRKEIFRLNDYSICSLETCNTLDILDEFVEKLQKEYNNGWIPVSERLPDEPGVYLATFDDGYVASVPYEKDWELWCNSGEPIAWQPLPGPYQPKGE